MDRKIQGCALLIASALVLSSCSGAPAPVSQPVQQESAVSEKAPQQTASTGEAGPARYVAGYLSGKTYRLDAAGVLCPKEEEEWAECRDPLTGEIAYWRRTRIEPTGGETDYGEPDAVKRSALYDSERNLLVDWDDATYYPAFSHFVIRKQGERAGSQDIAEIPSALWDPVTGETVLQNVGWISAMPDERFAAFTPDGLLLGVLDKDANVLAGFPAPVEIEYAEGISRGAFVGEVVDSYLQTDEAGRSTAEYVVLDENLNERYRTRTRYLGADFSSLHGAYLLQTVDDVQRAVLSLDDFSVRLTFSQDADGDLVYYDGERMILSKGGTSSLLDGEKQPLLTVEGVLSPSENSWQENLPSVGTFFAWEKNEVKLLDRDGKTLHRFSHPDLCRANLLADGFCSYAVSDEENGETQGLLEPSLNEIVPAGTYLMFQPLLDESDGEMGECVGFAGMYRLANGRLRYDLIDLSGKVVLTRLSDVGSAGADAVAVIRGSYVGLVDLSGNWIFRSSIYSSLEEE